MAVKCNGRIQGATVTAQVTTSAIRVLESKTIQPTGSSSGTSSACGIEISTGEYAVCTGYSTIDCYEMTGTKLTSYTEMPPRGSSVVKLLRLVYFAIVIVPAAERRAASLRDGDLRVRDDERLTRVTRAEAVEHDLRNQELHRLERLLHLALRCARDGIATGARPEGTSA